MTPWRNQVRRYFGTDVSFYFCFICGEVKAGRAVDTVGVEQRHGWHFVLSAHGDQFLGQGSTFEEAESGTGVKFYKQVVSTQYSVKTAFTEY